MPRLDLPAQLAERQRVQQDRAWQDEGSGERSGIGHEQAERQKGTDRDVLVVHEAL